VLDLISENEYFTNGKRKIRKSITIDRDRFTDSLLDDGATRPNVIVPSGVDGVCELDDDPSLYT
jgi:hypothetical protein